MKQITVKTPAKINYTLEILNKRPDGYHNIQSIMQTISLYDFLEFEISSGDSIKLLGNSNEIPYNESNLVYRAAKKFFEITKIKTSLKVYIEKHIPVSAGLAGGSTNAAGTIFALNKLFDYPLNDYRLNELCASLGSDINFCLKGGCCLCTSRGEIIEPLPVYKQKVSLIKPKNIGISTKEAYSKYSLLKNKANPNYTTKLKTLLLENKFDEKYLYNSFEEALFADYKELYDIKNAVKNSLMTGSGSTFFVLRDKIDLSFCKNNYEIFENLETIQSNLTIL